MAITRVQFDTESGGNNAALTNPPAENDLLVFFAGQRSGVGTDGLTISGSGWNKFIGRDFDLGDTDYRRSLSGWWKIAGASEPQTVNVEGDAGARYMLQQFNDSAGGTWNFRQKADNDNGATSNATSLATGTTPSVSAGVLLTLGMLIVKNGEVPDITSVGWASLNLASNIMDFGAVSFGVTVASAFLEESGAGTRASTATISGSGTANEGLMAGIAVFEAVGTGGAALVRVINETLQAAEATVKTRGLIRVRSESSDVGRPRLVVE